MTTTDARFAALQARLADLPSTRLADLGQEAPVTVIGLPSLNLGEAYLRRTDLAAYETRWLYLLLALRRPHARVAVVTSQPVDPGVVAYHLAVAGDPDVGGRLALVSVDDPSPRPLAAKLLDRPDLIERLRAFAAPAPAFVHPFAAHGTPERDAALALDVPLLGIDHRFASYTTKSAGRGLLERSGVPVPAGVTGVRDADDVVRALGGMRRASPDLRAAVVKLDEGVTGAGNAVVELVGLPAPGDAAEGGALEDRIAALGAEYLSALAAGGVVEELIDSVASPSVQVTIHPDGSVEPLSAHDQVLGGPLGHTFVGCRFPTADADAVALAVHGVAVGRTLAAEGAVGRFAIDFVVDRRGRALAVEVNPREGATTHPHGTLTLLDGPAGFLRASDAVAAPGLRDWRDAVAAVRDAGLAFDRDRGAGAILHMLDGVVRNGRLGVIALGTSAEQAEAVFDGASEALRVAGAARNAA